MIRWLMLIAMAVGGCGGSPGAAGVTGDTAVDATEGTSWAPSSSSTITEDCDVALDCGAGCASFDPASTSYRGYGSLAVDCAEGGHALLQDNLFGVNAYFDGTGALIALHHFSDVAEFCGETAFSYWEGDPVVCTPTCAHGGFDGVGYATGDPLPDCG